MGQSTWGEEGGSARNQVRYPLRVLFSFS